MTKKPIREWLEELEEPYRSQAITNYENSFLNVNEKEKEEETNLIDALHAAFVWMRSPEGGKHWHDLARKINRGY